MNKNILKTFFKTIEKIYPNKGKIILDSILEKKGLDDENISALDLLKIIKVDFPKALNLNSEFSDVLVSADTSFFVFDNKNALIYKNDSASALLKSFDNETFVSSLTPWEQLKSYKLAQEFDSEKPNIKIKEQKIFKDGNIFYNVIQVPLINAENTVYAKMVILLDMSLINSIYNEIINKQFHLLDEIKKRTKIENELKESQIQIAQSAKLTALGTAATHIAHEVQSPLTVIIYKANKLKTILTEYNIPEADEILTQIEKVTKRLSNIIKGLRSFSRNAENDPLTTHSISEVIQDTLSIFSEQLKLQRVQLIQTGNFDYNIACRPSQVSQVLLNLIKNSMDATESFPEKWIKLESNVVGNRIQIKVTDCGSGIPEDVLKKLMTPFFTTKKVGAGTGIGLNISKKICEDHHGSLFYQLNNGHTCFVMEFPILV